MNGFELLNFVDHTVLKAFATWDDIMILCDEAVEYNTASVCIPPCYVKKIKDKYGDKINICTVVGFPLGYSVTDSKILECEQAIKDGGTTIRSYTSVDNKIGSHQNNLLVHKKENEKCLICKNLIKKDRINGRSTYYCSYCQK